MKKMLLVVISLMAALVFGLSCDGSGSTSLNNAKTLTGTAKDPNGDAVSGVTIYIPGTTSTSVSPKTSRARFLKLTATDGTTCDDPAETACASTCSTATGAFSLNTS